MRAASALPLAVAVSSELHLQMPTCCLLIDFEPPQAPLAEMPPEIHKYISILIFLNIFQNNS